MSQPARDSSPARTNSPTDQTYLDTKITLETYRTLLGLPQPRPAPPSSSLSTRLPKWWPLSQRHRRQREHTDEESPLIHDETSPEPSEHHADVNKAAQIFTKPTALYATLLTQIHQTTLLLTLHTTLLYIGPILQLLLSALIILLASSSPRHGIAIAVFAGLNGVLAGGLAMVVGRNSKREGLRMKRDGLVGVEERVRWVEREVELGLREVRLREVAGFRGEVGDLVGGRGG